MLKRFILISFSLLMTACVQQIVSVKPEVASALQNNPKNQPLAAQAHPSPGQQAWAETFAGTKECKYRKAQGEIKTHVEFSACTNSKMVAAFQKIGYPYMDLINHIGAKSTELAEKQDNGLLSDEDAHAGLTQAIKDATYEETQRNLAAKAARQ